MHFKKLLFNKSQYNVSNLITNCLFLMATYYLLTVSFDMKWTLMTVLLMILFIFIGSIFFNFIDIALSKLLGKKNMVLGGVLYTFVMMVIVFLYFYIKH